MHTEIINFNDLSISKEKIAKKIHLNANETDSNGFFNDLFDSVFSEISSLCKPAFLYRRFPVEYLSGSEILINGVILNTGKTITKLASGGEAAFVFVTTTGWEFENYLRSLKGESLREYFADAIGSEIPEEIIKYFKEFTIKNTIPPEFNLSLPFSPGYCGWNVAEQKKIFSLLPENPCDVILNESSLMTPIKSISGFIVAGNNNFPEEYLCKNCNNPNCIF